MSEVGDLFEASARWVYEHGDGWVGADAHDKGESALHELMGLTRAQIEEFFVEDALDTLQQTPQVHGIAFKEAQFLGSIIAMHSHVAFRAGFLLGRGEIKP